MGNFLLKLIGIWDIDFHSIKFKILVWFSFIVIIVLFIFSFAFYFFYKKSIILSYHNQIINISSKVKQKSNYHNLIYKISFIKNYKGKNKFFINFRDETFDLLYIEKYKDGAIKISRKNIDNKIETVEDSLLVLNPILLLILIVLMNIILDKILKPIKEITFQANNLDINNLPKKLELDFEETELKNIVNSFNNMIERIQNGIRRIEQFNSDVSHELKTPLSIIKAKLQLLEDSNLNIIEKEVNNIEQIVNELLLLTKYNNNNVRETFENLYLDSILIEILDKFEDKIKEKNINIEVLKLDYIHFCGNKILLKSMFLNLIENSIKYLSSKIKISLYIKKGKIYFIINDNGIGILEKNLSKITDRFYRIDESRNTKGFGLGLSIVKQAVVLHNGKLSIYSKFNKGTTIKIIL